MAQETAPSPAERRRQKRELRRTERRSQAKAAKSSQRTNKAIKWGIVVLLVGAAIFFVVRAASQASAAAPKEKFPYGTVHWHAKLAVSECGVPHDFSNLGDAVHHAGLTMLHTHGDNTIHIEGAPQYWHQITLGQYFKAINYPFSDTQLGKYKNGDPCPDGQPGTVKVIVDGQHSGVKSDLVLRDGKSIRVEYGP